jgi:hypothetical protein
MIWAGMNLRAWLGRLLGGSGMTQDFLDTMSQNSVRLGPQDRWSRLKLLAWRLRPWRMMTRLGSNGRRQPKCPAALRILKTLMHRAPCQTW